MVRPPEMVIAPCSEGPLEVMRGRGAAFGATNGPANVTMKTSGEPGLTVTVTLLPVSPTGVG